MNEDFSGQTFVKGSAADLAESFYDSITLAGRLDMFSRAAENTGISFCVARTDPQGNTSTGIDFADGSGKTWAWDDKVKRQGEGGLPAWDSDKYLNIWVCQLADSVSGYAQMPGGPLQTDGVVIDYRFFGCGGSSQAPFNKGKTLTHLIGNYMNLYDLWSYSNRCQDDNVSDTPVHNAPNMGGDHFRHITAEGTIESFDVGILHRLSRLNVQDFDLLSLAPLNKFFGGEFRSVVHTQSLGLGSKINDAFQYPDEISSRN